MEMRKQCGVVRCPRIAEPGRKRCKECRARDTQTQRERRKRLTDAGLCLACGCRPPRDGQTRCEECTAKYYTSKPKIEKAKPGEQFTAAQRASWWFSFEFPELAKNSG